jgi:uncharacterized protein YhbP (UPF0306 family)
MTNTDEPLFEGEAEAGSASTEASLNVQARIRELVERQPYAVLCTQSHTQPYGALVAFAFDEELKRAVLATPIATRKYRILSECRQVALVIDSRPDHVGDFMSVEAVTATGRATLLEEGAERERWAGLLVARHDYLHRFVASPSCALFRIDIVRFFHVARFQEVCQWRP